MPSNQDFEGCSDDQNTNVVHLETPPNVTETRRKKSLVRPDRHPMPREELNDHEGNRRELLGRSDSVTLGKAEKALKSEVQVENEKKWNGWVIFSKIITIYAPRPLLICCGMKTAEVRQAWREKIALCTIIFFLWIAVGFLTFGFQQVLCGWDSLTRIKQGQVNATDVIIHGRALQIESFIHPDAPGIPAGGNIAATSAGRDLSFLFQNVNGYCKQILNSNRDMTNYFPCVTRSPETLAEPNTRFEKHDCHSSVSSRDSLRRLKFHGDIYYEWQDLQSKKRNLVVYNGQILDFDLMDWIAPEIETPAVFKQLRDPESLHRGKDVTFFLNTYHRAEAKCAVDLFRVGTLDTSSMGCMISNVMLYISLIVIVGVMLVKFFLAVFFDWILSWRLGSFREETYEERKERIEAIEKWSESPNKLAFPHTKYPSRPTTGFLPKTSRYSTPITLTDPALKRHTSVLPSSFTLDNEERGSISNYSVVNDQISLQDSTASHVSGEIGNIHIPPVLPSPTFQPFNFPLAHIIMLVTCYSEGTEGMRTTLDSLALTDYPQSHKLIVIIADGDIIGSGNDMSTPDVCISMMKDFVIPPENVNPYSYVAIADGTKRHNMAKVYAGYYKFDETTVTKEKQQRVPMVLIAKCGSSEERSLPKPGNRGKRDSQIILMSFLQRVMFDDRMTEMEYELFNAIWSTTGVTADNFEIVLMVDADTKVYPDSVTRMVSCMVRDPQIMGLCGETKIANKTDSWVSMIQVFEYYISHHQSKAFEAIFGNVTCLPGCFSMYRIKSPKGTTGLWVPILANPDIVERYSENVVDTLHKKNLLLLGEDRFLTTLMLRTFPKRKMIFVPQAVCKTIVPDKFSVLLSQRRRWINSTIHNLLELVLIRDLCGTFCFSMQFVIFLELLGTAVLPAAICFTSYLIANSIISRPIPVIPLIILGIVLGLPAVLILMTTRKLIYVVWMIIYLISLPIWNLVLPLYAFWHFDDFSWGQTRVVAGETAGDGDHSKKDGEFDSSRINMKKWSEFERGKRRKTKLFMSEYANFGVPTTTLDQLGYHTPSQLARISTASLLVRRGDELKRFD
ncbi:Chitin synthase, class 3 [Basidiobolus ranarum]|uniref:chitin synthase n=1 Tax=Basidiobolus ranarum TaxID=34480 RepID=A0ABR2X059_9FUNG